MRFIQMIPFQWLLGALVLAFAACSDHSFVTDPDDRDDIASWYKTSSFSFSSSSTFVQSSSSEMAFSSSEGVSSSGSEIPSSSSSEIQSSSEMDLSSSSEEGGESSSSVSLIGSIFHEGQEYITMKIGNQVWFAQNLVIGSFNSSGTQTDDALIERNCYDNNQNLCETYGGLYTWAEALGLNAANNQNQTEFPHLDDMITQGICPKDWHVSTLADWDTLISFLGAEVAGKLVKDSSVDYGEWNSWLYYQKNQMGLLVLPSGFIDIDLTSKEMGTMARFWTTYESTATTARSIAISAESVTIANNVDLDKKSMLSIRCVKNKNQ